MIRMIKIISDHGFHDLILFCQQLCDFGTTVNFMYLYIYISLSKNMSCWRLLIHKKIQKTPLDWKAIPECVSVLEFVVPAVPVSQLGSQILANNPASNNEL